MSELVLYTKYSIIVGVIVWLIIPIRQYKTRYFWFFLILAFVDPVSIIASRNSDIVGNQLYVPFNTLLFFSVIDYKKIAVTKILFYLTIIGLGYFSFTHFWEYGDFFVTAILFLVLVIFIKQSFQFVIEKGSINTFHIVLVFYQAVNVFKFLNLLLFFSTGIWFFFISSILQFFIGIFFALYREDDPRFLIRVMGNKQIAD